MVFPSITPPPNHGTPPRRSAKPVAHKLLGPAATSSDLTPGNSTGPVTFCSPARAPSPALPPPQTVQPFWAAKEALADKTIIYGGSFNPPHIGHLMVCEYLLSQMGAKEVWLMPAYTHANKGNLAAFGARVGMCQLLASNGSPGIKVTAVEAQAPHTGSTYDVMQHVSAAYPERSFAFALGSDLAASAPTWSNWDKLTQLVPIAMVPRAGHPVEGLDTTVVPEFSSTEVCRRLRAGESIADMVPDNVVAFIRANNIYEAPASESPRRAD